jgi:hypothetical protein
MFEYHYSLIRFVPDAHRMEPINIGIILQGKDRIAFKLYTHASRKKEIDTATFQKWRKFFQEEIEGDAVPLFQPPKTSPGFLTHLQELCEKTVLLSRPLNVARDSDNFEQLLESLYQRLVAPPEHEAPEAANRPTGIFRQIAEERKFVQRGMKKHEHVTVGTERLWMAYRQVQNGVLIAMDKVEVASRIGATSYEIERLPHIAQQLPSFVHAALAGKSTRYCLMVDELTKPFTDQSRDEFEAMSEDLERAIAKIVEAGGQLVRDRESANKLADELDQKLPKLAGSMQD